MNYKRIVIFFVCMLGAAAFCVPGISSERAGNPAKLPVYAADGKREAEESGKIAVVNLDEGIPGNGRQVNYGERLSRFPSMDFEYASLEAARTGLETGKYGAYIIIPAAFSRNVESINQAPQVSQLEYAVNQSYSGRRQYELLYNVWSYIDSLNNHLSYMYVDNILREFHDAQDGAAQVLENDLRDLETMERVRAQDLVTLVEIPEMPEDEEMPETPDISGYTAQNARLLESLETEYNGSVQDIRRELADLNAGGNALAECLENLAGQAEELDLTVDESGESIAGKAEEKLRAELERQSECTLEKERVMGYLRKLKEDNEELMERFRQSSRIYHSLQEQEKPEYFAYEILYDDQNQPVLDSQGNPVLLVSALLEQAQELEVLLEETGRSENLDIGRITELVRTEYIEPMNSNADAAREVFQQRYEKGRLAVLAYNGQLAGFCPQADSRFLTQNISGLKENQGSMQQALQENNQAYREYAVRTAALSREYADKLQKHTAEAQKESEKRIAEGLSEAKEVKERNSALNQRILGGFSSKLPYTRIGSAENIRVYQFIANPLIAADKSVSDYIF